MISDMDGLLDPTQSIGLKLLFWVCGLSIFARSEAVFMQTQMFARCFNLGDRFFALASCAVFIPGILVQVIQHKFDVKYDRRFGTYKATTYRLILAVSSSVVALMALILGAYFDEHLKESSVFIYTLLTMVGLGISLTFGCFMQVITMFPSSMHSFFFVGTYSPFLLFAPVNVGVQDLCRKTALGEEWVTRWHSVLVYYILAAFLTLSGLLCYFGIAKHPLGKQYFTRKDHELHTMFSVTQNVAIVQERPSLLVNDASSNEFDFKQVPSQQSKSIVTEDVNGEGDDDLLEDNVVSAFSESDSLLDNSNAEISNIEMMKKCWLDIGAQVMMTICSTLIASLYIKFEYTTFEDLTTLLQYDYYISGAIGMFATSFKAVRRVMTSKVLFVLSVVRALLIPFAILYARGKLPRSDAAVLIINSIQMIIGGSVFSLSFTNACNKFLRKPERTKASTVMNVWYYIAMAIALGASLALG